MGDGGFCDTDRPSKLKLGVIGEGVCIAPESAESLRTSCGVCGESERVDADADADA